MLARRIVQIALSRMREGQLVVIERGRRTTYGRPGALTVTLTVHDDRFWRAVLRRGSVGLGEAYANRWFDADSLADLVRIGFANLAPIMRRRDRIATLIAPIRDRLPRSSRGREIDRRNVAAHYDLSNDFFSLMLDPTMAYSCAVFDETGVDLAAAQRAKFDRLCNLLDLGPDDHLLEIGTGWGGLAVHAASHYGCRVTTTTISAEQHAFAAKRISDLGLADRVEVLDRDYRDLDGTYDKVVSIEMIEAVDWHDHATFFSALAERVRPGGRAALQAIVIDDSSYERAKRTTDFIKRFIFPGGCLPSVASIDRSVAATGVLRTTSVDRIGQHYPETLRRWQQNLDARRADIGRVGLSARFQRIWDLYLQYCIGSFETEHIDVVQVVLQRDVAHQREGHHGPLPHHDRIVTAA